VEEKRPLRRQFDDHHFGSLLMLAVTASAFLLGRLGSHEGALFLPPRGSNPLKPIGKGMSLLRAAISSWEC
jgi:hypothetical protein